jgi:hypothetical protein
LNPLEIHLFKVSREKRILLAIQWTGDAQRQAALGVPKYWMKNSYPVLSIRKEEVKR